MKLDEATKILTKNGYILENSDIYKRALQAYREAKEDGAFANNYFCVQPGDPDEEDDTDEYKDEFIGSTYQEAFIDGYVGNKFKEKTVHDNCESFAWDIDARDERDEDEFIEELVSEYRDAYELGKAYAKNNF